MRLPCLPLACSLLLSLALPATPAVAQETVLQTENVRIDYAQVLHVEPVYQTLTATRMEQRCDGKPAVAHQPARGLSRIVGRVKDALTPKDGEDADAAANAGNCRMVPVEHEFRRPIAFDVDYIYKGMKYRSRLPADPGNRLRVRVSVTPYVAPAGH